MLKKIDLKNLIDVEITDTVVKIADIFKMVKVQALKQERHKIILNHDQNLYF